MKCLPCQLPIAESGPQYLIVGVLDEAAAQLAQRRCHPDPQPRKRTLSGLRTLRPPLLDPRSGYALRIRSKTRDVGEEPERGKVSEQPFLENPLQVSLDE